MAKRAAKTTAPKRIKVTQIRSGIGFDKKQSQALQGLGLRRIRHQEAPSLRLCHVTCRPAMQVRIPINDALLTTTK